MESRPEGCFRVKRQGKRLLASFPVDDCRSDALDSKRIQILCRVQSLGVIDDYGLAGSRRFIGRQCHPHRLVTVVP
jgi:hypothetical protein